MAFWKDFGRAIANPIGYAGERIGGQRGRNIANAINPTGSAIDRVTGQNPEGVRNLKDVIDPRAFMGHGGQLAVRYDQFKEAEQARTGGNQASQGSAGPGGTPAQQRDADIEKGQARWRDTVMKDEMVQDILGRRKDMSQGLNAEEMGAARDLMIAGQQGQEQKALRSMYQNQARAGVRGGMAAAQNARLQRQFGQDRATQEQKMLIDNYNLRRQGLEDYQKLGMGLKFGEMGQGLNEAGMGVADRTGASQEQLARMMYQQAGQRGGLFGGVSEFLFG
jgi:hypothetical protein